MAKITYIEPSGERKTIDVPPGSTVMDGAVDNNVDGIIASCGGSCSCSTCHVYVDEEWIGRTGRAHLAEQDTLEFAIDVRENSRLSCQIEVTDELDGLVVQVVDEQA
ncbi:MAG: 2Fe-2S ferredoxin [Acidobacteria bacterium]|nr:MAG: 2Fe-2S ferredoxin [Acidobacteriota bacterium]REK07655.1 MAG: 2Fe-2S ferredoxin [Acidobacteriota bacterium]